jgi:hypothetical protein
MCGLLGGSFMETGCSAAWIGEAEKIVGVLIPATANLVTLVSTLRGNSTADLQVVQSAGSQAGADLQTLETLIAQYQKADAAGQAGLLGQIQDVMAAVESTMNGLLPALHVEDAATQAKVSAVVELVLSEIEAIASLIPAADPALVQKSAGLAPQRRLAQLSARQLPLSADRFVSSYNTTMTKRTGNAELDRTTVGLRIHAHGKLERWASVGLLK